MKDKNIDISKFSQRERKDVPEEFTWNVRTLYASVKEWENDRKNAIEGFKKISQKKKNWTNEAKGMFEMLELISEIKMKISKLYVYVYLLYDTDMSDNKYGEMEGEIKSLSVEFQSLISFVESDIAGMNKKTIGEYYKAESRLVVYKRKIDLILKLKKHILSEEKERLVSMTGLFSDGAEKASSILNNMEIPKPEMSLSNGEIIMLDTASYVRHRASKNRKDRRNVTRVFWENQEKFENTLAILLNAEIQNHVFHAKVYNYENSLEASLLPGEIDRDVYLNLIKNVKANLAPLHKYLGLKKKLLGIKNFSYSDIYASSVPGVDREYSIDEAKELVTGSLEVMGDDYIENLKKGFSERWMDIYPNKAKRSGAYSNGGVYEAHPFVLMNFNGKYNEVSTLAHEFGHAMHSFYSNKFQPYPTAGYPIFLAEIASTFNETLLVDYVLKNEKDETTKLYIIDKHLDNLRANIYRQTLFAEFELMMHDQAEAGKALTAEWLNKNYLKLTKEYYGHEEGVLEVEEYFKSEWSWIPHFYYNFYVYQYSTGIIAALSLVDLVKKEGVKARDRYLELLKSGNSKPPLEILKLAGVDLLKNEPINRALSKFDDLVDEMEKIISKKNYKVYKRGENKISKKKNER